MHLCPKMVFGKNLKHFYNEGLPQTYEVRIQLKHRKRLVGHQNKNNFTKVMVNSVSEIMRRLRSLLRMPNHISANEATPHKIGNPALM